MVLSKLYTPRLPQFLYHTRHFSKSHRSFDKLRIAVIGQSTFAAEVYKLLVRDGHKIVGVFTVPDQGNREDPLATIARENDTPLFKLKTWQKKGDVLPEVMDMYRDVKADLNVLPFCIQFIPMQVINFPKHQSICYHPSILPRHRGVSAISWTLIEGDKDAGFTIFWPDDGLDTGPILLQKTTKVLPNDTLDSLYSRFMYPEGITAMAEAVNMVADGTAPKIVQPEEGASYDPSLKKGDVQLIKWNQPAKNIHNFIRGMDSSPGARGSIDGREVRFFGSTLWRKRIPRGKPLTIDQLPQPAIQHKKGLLIKGSDDKYLNVERISVDGKMMPSSKFGSTVESTSSVQFTDEEEQIIKTLRSIWKSILNIEVENSTDFFKAGAGSMDVVRLVEEVKDKVKIEILNQDVFMATIFEEFSHRVIEVSRSASSEQTVDYDAVELRFNNIDLRFPHQLFINGEFVNSQDGATFETINPADESIICRVQSAGVADVDLAVESAASAFEDGEWPTISARERGRLLFNLADLMEKHKEELATLESMDAGAVYTLALKTHVGMSIETWRYFAGWTDKIQGATIPITNARPNNNLTYTKKEPIGVCGLITPWNYPLMMLSWKMAACLAAGNTVVIKPAEVTPLTALKFAELSVLAGIPPGVINVIPGSGRIAGHALASHPLVRKIGFTGSTRVGHDIMRAAADSNLKKVSLELGGKSPLIIFGDADLNRAVKLAMQGVFFNKGENCIAAGRIFVESSIHDQFVKKVVEEVEKIVISDPLDRSASHGPQNHKAHMDKLLNYVERGKTEGATLVYGGDRLPRPGFFFRPAVFTNVSDDMFIAKEEAFGPVMVISQFDEADVEDVLQRANSTEYGLASGVFTQDINRALLLADKIEAGTVFINTYNKTDVAAPFGGFKMSGFGKDLGAEALNEYLKTKCVTIEY